MSDAETLAAAVVGGVAVIILAIVYSIVTIRRAEREAMGVFTPDDERRRRGQAPTSCDCWHPNPHGCPVCMPGTRAKRSSLKTSNRKLTTRERRQPTIPLGEPVDLNQLLADCDHESRN